MSLAKKIHPREGEVIFRAVYRYQLTYLWKYIIGFTVILASSFFMFRLFAWQPWGIIVFGLGILIGILIIIRTYIFNRVNVLVITDQRVVDIHRMSWFDETISSLGHHDILDVSVRHKGLLQSIFNYGTLSIHTKNSQFALDIAKVRDPSEIQALLLEVGEKHTRSRHAGDVGAICRNFIKIIPELSKNDLRAVSGLITERLATAPDGPSAQRADQEEDYEGDSH